MHLGDSHEYCCFGFGFVLALSLALALTLALALALALALVLALGIGFGLGSVHIAIHVGTLSERPSAGWSIGKNWKENKKKLNSLQTRSHRNQMPWRNT